MMGRMDKSPCDMELGQCDLLRKGASSGRSWVAKVIKCNTWHFGVRWPASGVSKIPTASAAATSSTIPINMAIVQMRGGPADSFC